MVEYSNFGEQNDTTMSCITSAEYLPARTLSMHVSNIYKTLYQKTIWRVYFLRLFWHQPLFQSGSRPLQWWERLRGRDVGRVKRTARITTPQIEGARGENCTPKSAESCSSEKGAPRWKPWFFGNIATISKKALKRDMLECLILFSFSPLLKLSYKFHLVLCHN